VVFWLYLASVRSSSTPIQDLVPCRRLLRAGISIKIVADKRKKKVDITVRLVVSGS
jgi:hypothetical protein